MSALPHPAVVPDAPRLRRPDGTLLIGLLAAALLAAMVVAAATGAFAIAPREVLAIVLGAAGVDIGVSYSPEQASVLEAIRLPRVAMAMLTGAGLATAGAAMQGLFRNPLADPGLIGVSSGAALAAAFVIVLGARRLPWFIDALGPFAVPLAAFIGGLATTVLIYVLASREGHASLPVMLLAGIAANALTAAGIGLLVYLASDEQLRALTFWTLGSLSGIGWKSVLICAPCVALALAMILRLTRPLNAMLLGEREAGHLGIEVARLKAHVVIAAALAIGVLTGFTGIIGFVGLVAPHILRLIAGPDHRTVLPGSALLGAILVLVADTASRVIVAPAELPIGIVTALVGAPFFLGLLMQQRRAFGGS